MLRTHLSNLRGDLLIFGGPYSNLQATQAMRRIARDLRIPPDHCICTGDVIAYCGDPVATWDEIRDWGCVVVSGNCEQQLAQGAQDCGCGFDEGTTCDRLSAEWYVFASQRCTDDMRAQMANCPEIVTFDHAGRRCAVIHGGATNVARFIWSVSEEAVFEQEHGHLTDIAGPVDRVFAGHCGIGFHRQADWGDWINAGVIGMPPHDGATQTRYVIVDRKGGVTFHSLTYDAQGAARSMADAGLSQDYATALTSGIWPSQDVLPLALRR